MKRTFVSHSERFSTSTLSCIIYVFASSNFLASVLAYDDTDNKIDYANVSAEEINRTLDCFLDKGPCTDLQNHYKSDKEDGFIDDQLFVDLVHALMTFQTKDEVAEERKERELRLSKEEKDVNIKNISITRPEISTA